MVVFTETVQRAVESLAGCGGELKIEIHEDAIIVTVTKAPRAPKIRKTEKLPGKDKAKPHRRKGEWTAVNESTGAEETHTAQEWAKIVGATTKAVQERLYRHGTPYTARYRSKFDKASSKRLAISTTT